MDKIGYYFIWDVFLVGKLGWERFLSVRQGLGDQIDLGDVDHPPYSLLHQYQHLGSSVVLVGR